MTSEATTSLSPEQADCVETLFQELKPTAEQMLREMLELLVRQEPETMFGKTEFQLRDLALQLGAKAQEATINMEAKKGGM